ncbi:MAG: 50S ribosomal protein L29 [Methanobacteriota archaeon]|nr:MAG: 50S ribosomal protein L29 [Euryarchaeota archaeon]
MSFISNRDIASMNREQLERRLVELQEEMLLSNSGDFKQTRRSIARMLTKLNEQS